MALIVQDKSGYELAAGNGGKPRFIYSATSAVKRFTTSEAVAKWVVAPGNIGGTDISETTSPAVYGIDNRASVRTSVENTLADVYYVIQNPLANTGAEEVVDCFAVINNNFNTDNIIRINFQASDDQVLWTTLRTHNTTGTDNSRIWIPKFNTGHTSSPYNSAGFTPQETTNARFFRIWCEIPVTPPSTSASFGEVIFGRSVYLKGHSLMPWDDRQESSNVSTFETRNGDRINYVNYSGKKERVFKYKTNDEEEVAALDRLWKQTGFGTGSFLFDAATNFVSDETKPGFYRYNEPTRALPISWGANGRDWELTFSELPPFQSESAQ